MFNFYLNLIFKNFTYLVCMGVVRDWCWVSLSITVHLTPLDRVSLNLELSGWLDWLAVCSQISAWRFPCPLSAKVMEVSQHTSFCMVPGNPDSGPQLIGSGWCSQKEAGERRLALESPGCSISEHIILRECGVPQVPNQAVLEIC